MLLADLADRGLETHGVEVSEKAAHGADRRTKITVAARLADAGYPASYFDAVFLLHVLEHLPEPRETMCEIRRVLRPGGKLVVEVPNFSSWQAQWAGPAWFHLDLPRHLFHFPASALRRLLVETGFRVETESQFSFTQGTFGWLQSALNRTRLPRNGLYTLLHERPAKADLPYDARTRWALRLAWVLGMPAALGLSMAEATARRGAIVRIVARSTASEAGDGCGHSAARLESSEGGPGGGGAS